ncbi:MarR family transcriptional regulator, partial [Bordetella avium]
MNEQAVSDEQRAMVSNIGARLQAEVLQRLAAITQKHAADCMGVDPSTVSRIKSDAEKLCHLMAAMGIQFAPADAMVV